MVFGLLVVGVLVRGTRVSESLWYDEIAAWRDYASRGPRWIVTTYDDPANHVAHTLLSWASAEWLGDALGAEIALRLPALIFSLLAVPALFALGRRAASARVGLLAASVAALAPVAVLEAADARAYSMMIFFSAAATAQMLKGLETRGVLPWVLYAGLGALGVWAHLMTAFVVVGHGVWLVGRALRGGTWRPAAAGIAGAVVLSLLLYAPILGDVIRVRRTFAGSESAGPSPFGSEGFHTILQCGGAWVWWAALPGLLLAALGVARAARDDRARNVVLLALLGLPALYATLLATGTWTYARFALFALPGALLLIALGLDVLWTRRVAACAAFAVMLAGWATDLAIRPPRQPLREAADFVETAQHAGDRVVVIGLRHAVLEVYTGALDASFSLMHGADLDRQLTEHDPAWVIVTYPNSVAPDRYDLLRARGFEPRVRLPGWIDWTNGDVVIWGKRTEAAE